eukprot:jgi/Botrbrau1/21962/Bobra.0249s0085.1
MIAQGVFSCVIGGCLWFLSVLQKHEVDKLKRFKELSSLEDVRGAVGALPLLVAVRGETWAKSPIAVAGDHRPAVIVRVDDFVVEWLSVLRKFYTHRVRRAEREVPWCLQDESGVRLPVIDGRSAQPLDLNHLGTHGEVAPLWQTTVWDWILGVDPGMRSPRTFSTEEVLPMDTPVTAIGELSWAAAGSHVPPEAVKVGDRVIVLQLSGAFFALQYGGLACFCGLVWRAIESLRQRRRARAVAAATREAMQDEHSDTITSNPEDEGNMQVIPSETADNDLEAGTCVICYTTRCNTVFPQCGHVCVCQGCSRSLDRWGMQGMRIAGKLQSHGQHPKEFFRKAFLWAHPGTVTR